MSISAQSSGAPAVVSLSSDDYRLIIESIVDYSILMLDPKGRVVTWNVGSELIWGYKAD
jgi:hypothetical protein